MISLMRKAVEAVGVAAVAAWYKRNGFSRLAALIGSGSPTNSGKAINVEAAMRCSVPLVATRAITETLASLPLPVLRKVNEQTELARKLPLWGVLNERANGFQTSYNFRRVITHHALNYGTGLARVIRRGDVPEGDVIGMVPIHPSHLVKKDVVAGNLVFVTRTGTNQKEETLLAHQAFHLLGFSDDGVNGTGIVELAKEPIAQLLSIEQYGSTFFARGGMVAGILRKHVPFQNEPSRQQFREDIEKTYEGNQGFHKKLILEGEFDYKTLGSNPTEAQLVGARESMIPELCRFYNMTPHLAHDLSRAHFANVEHLWIEFVNVTLGPWMIAWEQEIKRVLLTPKQQDGGYYAKHNADAFQRGDFEARMRGFSVMLQNGIASINEVRALLDWDPVDGGEAHHIQLNMQTVPGSGEATASESAALLKVSNGRRRQ